jgi:hypothetical protein
MSVLSVPSDLNPAQTGSLPPSPSPHQMRIPIESGGSIGLSESWRAKALAHLANLLLMAAGAGPAGDEADER